MTSHESSRSADGAAVADARAPNDAARPRRGANTNPTTRTPALARKSRRETVGALRGVMLLPPSGGRGRCRFGRTLDRADDSHVRSAPAQVGRQGRRDLVASRARRAGEQSGRADDHRADAVAALRRLLVDERLL